MNKKNLLRGIIALTAIVTVAFAFSNTTLFASVDVNDNSYAMKCGGEEKKADAKEAKEAKCGEGKCGGEEKAAKKVDSKEAKEAKCGEGKCGGEEKAAKKADSKEAKEGKCGEGKCGL